VIQAGGVSALLQVLEENPSFQTIDGSRSWLYSLNSTIDLLQLFERTFPEAFQATLEQGLSPFPTEECPYSECELAFFDLVRSRLFPLPRVDWVDEFFGETRLLAEMIFVMPQGICVSEEDFSTYTLPLGWQLVCYLIGLVDEEEFKVENPDYEDMGIFSVHVERGQCAGDLLISRFVAQGEIIAGIYPAIQMLYNDTDSIWLNATYEEPYDGASWNDEDIARLHEQYLLALDIRAKAERFCHWLEDRPRERFNLIARIWNTCVRDTAALDQDKLPHMLLPAARQTA
jgi:hypothetical protein